MLTPWDFMDEKHCNWIVLSKAKSGPKLRYACTTCSAISKTKQCPAFRDAPSPLILEGQRLLRKMQGWH